MQVWTRPGAPGMRLPEFLDNLHITVTMSAALRTVCIYPQEAPLLLQSQSATGRNKSTKNPIYIIGNVTCLNYLSCFCRKEKKCKISDSNTILTFMYFNMFWTRGTMTSVLFIHIYNKILYKKKNTFIWNYVLPENGLHGTKYVKRSLVTGLEWPIGFREIKVPRFHDNSTGRW